MPGQLEAYWSPVPSRALRAGQRYLFAVAAAGSTEQAMFGHLESRGWQIVSMGAPPAEMKAAIGALQALLPKEQGLPQAWRVIAIWKGPDNDVMPKREGAAVVYGPVAVWFEPVGPALPGPVPAQEPMGFGTKLLLATLGVGIVVGGTVLLTRRLEPRTALAENPKDQCWGPEAHKHKAGCRPGRPLCRWRRRAKGLCSCPAFPFPHREGSCAPVIEKYQQRFYKTGS